MEVAVIFKKGNHLPHEHRVSILLRTLDQKVQQLILLITNGFTCIYEL